MRLRLDIQYDGTHFAGWQSQKQGERTVQDELTRALRAICTPEPPVAAGRTDSGVHALCMPVHVDVEALRPSMAKVALAINAHLPRDISVLKASEDDFHARFDCTWRSYRYIMYTGHRQPLLEGKALQVLGSLDIPLMQEGASYFVGEHNFKAFATQEERQPVRLIYHSTLTPHSEQLYFEVTGESFLRHQIRAMVGTLLMLGQHKISLNQLKSLLEGKERKDAGMNVKPHGLYFMGAGYTRLK